MARKKADAAGAGATETRKGISQRKLKALMASCRSAKNDISEIAGTLGTEIKNAVETEFLHKKAFNVIRQLDRMEPDKLADFLNCFEHYLDISGLQDRADSAPALDMGDGQSGDDDAEDDKPSRVTKFPQPRGEAAE